jgi:hypothetical protein
MESFTFMNEFNAFLQFFTFVYKHSLKNKSETKHEHVLWRASFGLDQTVIMSVNNLVGSLEADGNPYTQRPHIHPVGVVNDLKMCRKAFANKKIMTLKRNKLFAHFH